MAKCRGLTTGKRRHEPLLSPCRNGTSDPSGLCHKCQGDPRIALLVEILPADWVTRIKGGPKLGRGRPPHPSIGEEELETPRQTKEGASRDAPPRIPAVTTTDAVSVTHGTEKPPEEKPTRPVPKSYHTLMEASKAVLEKDRARLEELTQAARRRLYPGKPPRR